MNYCFNCGRKLNQGDKFCANCGTEIYSAHSAKLIHFSCDSCNTKYSAKSNQAGKSGICKTCGERIFVPDHESAISEGGSIVQTEPSPSYQTKASPDILCPGCVFLEEQTGVCKKFYFNVHRYSNKYMDKCDGRFYKKDPSKDVDKSDRESSVEHTQSVTPFKREVEKRSEVGDLQNFGEGSYWFGYVYAIFTAYVKDFMRS